MTLGDLIDYIIEKCEQPVLALRRREGDPAELA